MLLRDTRASCDSQHFGGSLEKETITIWKSDSPSPLATVKPGFSGGANRHAIDPVNHLIYAGTWEGGITCFDYAANRVAWQRTGLPGIQSVDLSAGFPGSVFLTLEAPESRLDEPGILSGIVELDARDGSTKWTRDRENRAYFHPRQGLILIQDSSDSVIRILDSTKKEIGSAPMIHFSIIDVAFGDGMIVLAEGESGARILDYRGKVISRYVPEDRRPNCIRAAFHQDRVLLFDSWDASFITAIDPNKGEPVSEYQRITHDTPCFIDEGSRFVDSSGKIFRSSDGLHVATLEAGPDR